VKPFRTREDIYVNAILLYLMREARRLGVARELAERCCVLFC
jgi:hypothetical protein